MLQVNCQSIGNKIIEFWNLVETYSPDIVIATESWLYEDINTNEINQGSYVMYRRDRVKRGGGLFICVHKNIVSSLKWTDSDHELLCVQISDEGNNFSLQVIGAYRPPKENFSLLDTLYHKTCTGNAMNKNIIIAGDLNLPSVDWSGESTSFNQAQVAANKFLREGGFSQVVDFPTRGNNTLDVYLVRPEELYTSCHKIPGVSDHSAVVLNVRYSGTPKPDSDETIKIFQYRRADQGKFQEYLEGCFARWTSEGCHINILWENFLKILNSAIRKFVPFKLLKHNPDPEYYTREIRSLKRKVRKAYNKRHASSELMQKFKSLARELVLKKKAAHDSYMQNLFGSDGNGWKNFYRYVRRRKGNSNDLSMIMSSDGKIYTDKQAIANELNVWYGSVFNKSKRCVLTLNDESDCSVFQINQSAIEDRIKKLRNNISKGPDNIVSEALKLGGRAVVRYLEFLFNVSINNIQIPDDWKKAIVVPIFKGGNRLEMGNYRPVSLTSIVSKQMEHLISGYLREQWVKLSWLNDRQHGFRQGYSCESQMLSLFQDISESLDNGVQVDAIVIDFAKAFDVVPHDILLRKLAETKIDRRVLSWIKEFLTGRSQKVKVGNEYSDEIAVTSGVPQGSVIGPLLFLALINDLPNGIQSDCRLFADDCVVYRKIHCSEDNVVLQDDLNLILKWALDNKMKINMKKCGLIKIGRGQRQAFQYTIGSEILVEEDSCKYLGVHVRNDLKWSTHVGSVVSKAYKSLHFVMRVLKGSSASAKELGYLSLVRPILEYGSAVWDPYQVGLINDLEMVQRKAARFVLSDFNPRSSVSRMIEKLGWESLEARRKRSRLCAMFNTYTNQPAWRELNKRLEKPTYISRVDHPFKVKGRPQRTNYGKYSFINRGVDNWNALPAAVLEPFPKHIGVFKRRMTVL